MRQRPRVSVTHEPIDRRIAHLASQRHGVFSRSEAGREGASRGLIERRISTGRWESLHPGVYRLVGTHTSWRQSLLAACLAAGAGAAASHRSAGALRNLAGIAFGAIELSVPRGRRVRRPHVTVHEVTLPAVDVTVVDAIPVTTPTRTLLDLAAVVPTDVLEEAPDDALRRNLTTLARLRWRAAELGRRPGSSVIRELIETRAQTFGTPQSVLETRFLRLLKHAQLPEPVCQHQIREQGRLLAIVDFAYPEARVAIEVDGYRWHSGRARWEHDLARRNKLTSRGWRILHVTSNDLERRPNHVIRTIREMLD